MSTIKILVVENELFIAEHLALKLSEAGYEVVGMARRGKEAVEMASVHMPDLIVMDIKLDGKMDGIEAAIEINKERKVPVIYLTDLDNKKTIERAELTLPAAYLIKPFSERQLKASIHQALSNISNVKPAVVVDNEIPADEQFRIKDSLFLRLSNSHFTKVLLSEITHIKADGAYCDIHVANGDKHTYCISLNHMLEKINTPSFVRVHKSSAVNLEKVTAVKGNLLMIGEGEIQIGEKYKNGIMNFFPIVK